MLSDSINRYWFEGRESPVLNLTSKLAGFALTLRVNRATKMNSVWQGVSEYRSYSLRLTVEIFGFIQQNSGAVASQRSGVSQSGPRGTSHTATRVHGST